MEGEPPETNYNYRKGYWIKETNWPISKIFTRNYHLNKNKKLEEEIGHKDNPLGYIDSPQDLSLIHI